MRTVAFHSEAFSQFTDWASEDPKRFERIVRLIGESARTPFSGIGKPEPSSRAAGRAASIKSTGSFTP